MTRRLTGRATALCLVATLIIAAAPSARAAFPGRNGLIVYSSGTRLSSEAGIFTIRPDGSEERRLTESGANLDPTWSSDGSQIAYVCDADICVMDEDGTDVRRLMTTPGINEHQPTWSPDGDHILFSRRDLPRGFGTESKIFRINVDGSEEEQLTDFSASDPQWAPDGNRIVFTRGRSGTGGVWSMRPDGSRVRKVFSRRYNYFDSPTWSPDGRRIVVSAQIRNVFRLVVMRRDGTRARELIKGSSGYGVAWSPNGKRLVFVYVGVPREHHDVAIIDLSGQMRRRLGGGNSPDWQPR